MKFLLEFYFQDECIEQRTFDGFFIEPQLGDKVRIQFQNDHWGQSHGYYWRVLQRQILYHDSNQGLQTLQVNVMPDQAHGAWDNSLPDSRREK